MSRKIWPSPSFAEAYSEREAASCMNGAPDVTMPPFSANGGDPFFARWRVWMQRHVAHNASR